MTEFGTKEMLDRGYAFERDGLIQQAISEYEKIVAIDRDFHPAVFALGVAYGRVRDFPRCIQFLERSIQLKPDYAPGHWNLALAFGKTGQAERMDTEYRRAMELDKSYAEVMAKQVGCSAQEVLRLHGL